MYLAHAAEPLVFGDSRGSDRSARRLPFPQRVNLPQAAHTASKKLFKQKMPIKVAILEMSSLGLGPERHAAPVLFAYSTLSSLGAIGGLAGSMY